LETKTPHHLFFLLSVSAGSNWHRRIKIFFCITPLSTCPLGLVKGGGQVDTLLSEKNFFRGPKGKCFVEKPKQTQLAKKCMSAWGLRLLRGTIGGGIDWFIAALFGVKVCLIVTSCTFSSVCTKNFEIYFGILDSSAIFYWI